MKKLLAFSAAIAFISFSSFGTVIQPLTSAETAQLRPFGSVSAQGARTLDDLETKLAEKAREQGAKGYIINAAGGQNLLYGNAIIYK